MLSTLRTAVAEGYGVMVLNPNANSIEVRDPEGNTQKLPIEVCPLISPILAKGAVTSHKLPHE